MTLFNSTKLNASGPFIHATDALANKGQIVSFYHLLSGRSISFKAFITAFNETYNCDWDSSTAYGRTDPVYVYKNIKRAITIGLKIPAATLSEGYENLLKLQNLIQFLYPKYKMVNSSSRTIGQSPLVRLRLMNLIKNQADPTGKTFKEIFTEGETKSADAGLLGFIKNVAISHNLETDVGVLEGGNPSRRVGEIIPKLIEVTIDFTAIHEHHLGWQKQRCASAVAPSVFSKSDTFPYGVGTPEEPTMICYKINAEGRAGVDAVATSADSIKSDAFELVRDGKDAITTKAKSLGDDITDFFSSLTQADVESSEAAEAAVMTPAHYGSPTGGAAPY